MKRQACYTHSTQQRLEGVRRSLLVGTCGLLLLALFLLGNDNAHWKAAARAASKPAAPLMNCVAPPQPNRMVSWHPLDETAGATVVNDIQGNHHGTPVPGSLGTLATDGPEPVPGKVAGALYFSGVPNNGDVRHIRVPHDPAFNLDQNDDDGFTIDAWIKPDTVTPGQNAPMLPIVDKLDPVENTGYVFYVQGGALHFDIAGGNAIHFLKFMNDGGGHLTAGVWQHVAIRYNRNQFGTGAAGSTFYVNGVAFPDMIHPGSNEKVYNTLDLLIGKTRYVAPMAGIAIDELEIFDSQLTDGEIMSLVTADSAGKCKPGKSCCGAWQQRTPAPAPSPRFRHAMAEATKCKKVVLFGGQTGAAINASTINGETWEWDGFLQTWTKYTFTGGTGPNPRAGHAMAYDAVHDKVVMFGGYDSGNNKLFETWEYDCATHTWTNRTHPATNPPGRAFHAMAYDPAKGIVLYGGQGISNPLNDTWTWTGNSVNGAPPVWTAAGTSLPLGNRVEHAMAYDGAKIILFGGSSTLNGAGLGDTWTFNPFSNVWSQLTTMMAPSPRRGHAMALGNNCSRVILYGGNPGNGTAFPTDTWEWDGMKWCLLSTNPPPGERENTAMAYDGAFPLTFGGRKFDQNLLGDTWLYGCNAPVTYPAGKMDNFSLAGKADTVYRRPALNAAFPSVTWKSFDVTTDNQWVGHSFDMNFLPNGIARAEVEVRMKPGTGTSNNDSVNFAFAGSSTPAIQWGINMATVTGSWNPGDPARTFTFDLANLPASGAFSTNLLQQFIANKFLDVVIQDDTVVDYIKLRVWLCPAEIAWGGVGGQPGGQAQLAVNSGGNLVISNIGASGNDGAIFRVGETTGASLKLADTLASLPNGSYVEMRGMGRVNGAPGSLTSSLRVAMTNTEIKLTPNYSAVGAATYHVALYNDGNTVFSQGGLSGTAVSLPAANVAPTLQFGGLGNIVGTEEVLGIAIIIVEDMSGFRVNGQVIGTGDTLVFTPENPSQSLELLSHLQLVGAGVSTVNLGGVGLRWNPPPPVPPPLTFAAPLFKVAGNAHLEAFTAGLGVANIGTSGTDGVTFDLRKPQSFSLNFDGIDMNNDLPPGAYLQANVALQPSVLPPPPLRVNSLKLIKGPPLVTAAPRTQYVPDFSALGAATWRVTAFNGATQVADVSNFTGTIETTVFPGALSHTDLTTLGFQVDFPDGTTLFLNGASNGAITSLRVLPQSSNTQIAYLTELSLLASNIPRVSFTDLTLVPVCNSAITVAPASLPLATLNLPYPVTPLLAAGGNPQYRFNVTGLPPGLTLSPTGILSGTPTQTGTFNVMVTLTDSLGCTGTKNYTLLVCPNITVNPATLPNGTVGSAYSATLTATGGTAPYTFTLVGIAPLPTGLVLNANTGLLSGTPTTPGSFTFGIQATDPSGGCAGTRGYTVVIACPTITVNPATLTNGIVGQAYNATFTATGGTAPYTFSQTNGTLPPGLSLNANTGVLSGTPTLSGAFNFRVNVTNTTTGGGQCTGFRDYTLTIVCPTITVNPATLVNGTVGVVYNQSVSATGGTGSYSFTRVNGTLPPGLTLATTGALTGTPTAAGRFNFTVQATDAGGCNGTRTYDVTVCADIIIGPSILPNARVNQAYNVTFTQTGGVGAASWRVSTGSLPQGLSLNAATGALTGTPTQAGAFNFTISVADANTCPGTRAYTLIVRANAVKADFDGDRKTDLSVWTPNTGNWSVLNSGNNQVQNLGWGAGFAPFNDVIVPGDYDGDGKADHAIWRGADSIWYIRPSSNPSNPILQLWGTSNAPYFDIPTPGDFDGDGKTDLAVWRRDGTWFVKRSSDGGFTIVTHGQNGDTPIPADYDGDGKTDFAVFRPNAIAPAPNWFILQSSTNTVVSFQWGAGYAPYFDTPVPADYDADGKADLAIWRGADSIWYIRPSATPNNPQLQLWGTSNAPYFDIPTPADYDGDGKADIAVFRRTGTWFVLRSSNGTFLIQTQGQQDDVPVPANGVR